MLKWGERGESREEGHAKGKDDTGQYLQVRLSQAWGELW
jgi:hypothetical protein